MKRITLGNRDWPPQGFIQQRTLYVFTSESYAMQAFDLFRKRHPQNPPSWIGVITLATTNKAKRIIQYTPDQAEDLLRS